MDRPIRVRQVADDQGRRWTVLRRGAGDVWFWRGTRRTHAEAMALAADVARRG